MIEAKINKKKHLKNAEINESILASFINFRKKKNLHIQSKVSKKIDKKSNSYLSKRFNR